MWELFGVMLLMAIPALVIGVPIWLLRIAQRSRDAIARVTLLEERVQWQRDAIETLIGQINRLQEHHQPSEATSARPATMGMGVAPAPERTHQTSQPDETLAQSTAHASAGIDWTEAIESTTAVPPPPSVGVPPVSPVAAREATSLPHAPYAPQPDDTTATGGHAPAPPPPPLPPQAPAAAPIPSPFQDGQPQEATAPEFEAAPAVDWETRLGTNWLSKLGVAAMVIGLALFVGYSFTTMGAAGRISMAALLSSGMLAGGVLFERREQYQMLCRGLIAGGWAGAYLTSFAAYGVEAAKVIDSPAVATGLLLAVATGMIVHSLRYRSQALTTLAFVLAALALGISDSFGFALGGLFPLAGALLVVAHRMRWPVLRMAGAAASYIVVALLLFFRSDVIGTATVSAVAIGLWLLFEFAAWAAMRRGEAPGIPVFLLSLGNAASLLVLLCGNGGLPEITSAETPNLQFATLTTGLMLAVAATVRAWLTRHQDEGTSLGDRLLEGGYLPNATIGAASLAAYLLLRFEGALEVSLLMALGLVLMTIALLFRQRDLARVADALFSFSLMRVYTGNVSTDPLFTFAGTAWSARALLALGHALMFYGNRLVAPQRAYYSIVGTIILLVTLAETLPPIWLGFGYLLASLGLLEAARRTRALSALLESWGVLAAAIIACTVTWLEFEASASLPWQPVAATAVLFYLSGWQLHRTRLAVLQSQDAAQPAAVIDQGALLLAGVCTALAAYQLIPDVWLPSSWLLLAVAWTAIGQRLSQTIWPAKALGVSFLAVVLLLAVSGEMTALSVRSPLFWLAHLLPTTALFWVWNQFNTWRSGASAPTLVSALYAAPSALATVVLATLAANLTEGVWVGLLWILLSILLTGAGLLLRKRDLRVEGYIVAGLAGFVSFVLLSEQVADWFQGYHELVAGILGTLLLLALFAVTLGLRSLRRDWPDAVWTWEQYVPTAAALTAGVFAVRVMFLVVEGRLLTMALGFEAIALLAIGVFVNLRAVRLGALGLLLFAVGKLFVYDLSSLVMPYRIASFFVLGALLLTVSWAYSRFGDRIRRLL